MSADEVVDQIITKHIDAYDTNAPDWTGFGISCWFGDGRDETVKYYYNSPAAEGLQMRTPSVYDEFEDLQLLLQDPKSVHAVVITYVKETGSKNMRIIRDSAEAEKYQNWFGNPFDIAQAIRPPGV